MRLLYLPLLALAFYIAGCSAAGDPEAYSTWEVYHGSKEGIHYSSLQEMDTGNVAQLQPAWIFNTGDADTAAHSQMQCNPVIVDSVMYVTSPKLKLQALHAGTGKLIWSFAPDSVNRNSAFYHFILNNNRGVTYWSDGNNDKRIFYVAGSHLYAINAMSGKGIDSFGIAGRVDLHEGLERDVKDLFVTATSPGIVYKDLFILGSRVDEGPAAAPGHIRAFDVRTGKIRWIFHTIPQPGEPGYETWEDPEAWKHIGGANSWSGLTLDEESGMLFAPTGSASFDFYGGKRKGDNLFANCILALDAATGKRIWHYQFIHHDIWDWDTPTPPVLVTIQRDGKKAKAVAQVTKTGFVYVFERLTGKPFFPIQEMPVDTVTVMPGERLSPTQPIPVLPRPFVRQTFSEKDINPYLPDTVKARILKELKQYRYGNMFIPQSKQTLVQLPGLDGGAEWGGPAFDPQTGMLYVNANEMAWLLTLKETVPAPAKKETMGQAGQRLFLQHCMACHGSDRKGTGNFPSLINIEKKYADTAIFNLLVSGRRMMPSFKQITDEEKKAVISFITGNAVTQKKAFSTPPKPPDPYRQLPYTITGYYKFLANGEPVLSPPWGTLTAIDLNTGEHAWKITLGEEEKLTAKGVPPTGVENYGGPVVTAGGLVFIAAAKDGMLRAFNKYNGKLLWQYQLPAPGFATPAVYNYQGKQYIVIACGGGKVGTRSGDTYMAFALPAK